MKPGRHFVGASYDTLPDVVDALLRDPARLAEIRHTAYEALRTQWRLSDSIGVLRQAAADTLAAAPAVSPNGRVTAPRPAPKPPYRPPIEYHRLIQAQNELAQLRAGVKHLLLEQRALRRELARLSTPPDEGPTVVERSFGPELPLRPRVTVVVTVYNYRDVVGEALRSVAASTFRDFELVVVDDASHDGSVAAVQETLTALPWVSSRHLIRNQNAGLGGARNLGVERAWGDLVFILDADNAIYPHALERLVEALDWDQDAAFAYGILEKVDSAAGTAPTDLISWQPWDPGRLRYGNYIDAMALIRRDAILAAGGYTSDLRLYGWEDFALWCAFAQKGWRGAFVPEIVARYVAAVHSMISVTNIDATEAYATLARAYPFMAGAPTNAAGAVPWRGAAAPSGAS